MISTPSRERAMCGASGVKSSSQVSKARAVSSAATAKMPIGTVRWPVNSRTMRGR